MKKLNCILLIEDNHLTNILNTKIIESLGVTDHIEIAENGKDGLDYLQRKGKFEMENIDYRKPNLIFLDINMPVMSGWDFLEEYKNLDPDKKSKVLIVMLTTSPNPDDELRAVATGEVTEFKRKPLTKEMLLEIIKEYFPDHL